MQVHVAKAELWSMPVDAVVNPANSLGIMGGGIGGSLRRQGGDVIQQAAMAAAPIAVGAALVTTAGQLPAKNVIHVPTMEEPGMQIGAENVRRAARAALIAADRNNFKVIAIPGIESVHDLHVWTVTSNVIAMSVHAIVREPERQQHVLEHVLDAMRLFGIQHVTVQLERKEMYERELHLHA